MEKGPGTYALILESRVEQSLQIGRRGSMALVPGFYLYVGSAFGPGGIAARIAHHRRIAQRPHWHIDYLRLVLPLTECWFSYEARHMEHHWAAVAGGLQGASIPLARFGASDCDCPSHLFHFSERPRYGAFRNRLALSVAGHARLGRSRYDV